MVRSLWAEVIDRRKTMHRQADTASMELWPPACPDWTELLSQTHDAIRRARSDITGATDPRDALVDLLAVASAWIDAFDLRAPVT